MFLLLFLIIFIIFLVIARWIFLRTEDTNREV
jgi:hypothetical protein